jgi:hypothetical protein
MNLIEDGPEQMRRELSTHTLTVGRFPELPYANSLAEASRGNRTVQTVQFYTHCRRGFYEMCDLKVWEKVGEAVGNLEELQEIVAFSSFPDYFPDDGEIVIRHDWFTLHCILECLRHKIKLNLKNIHSLTGFEVRAFAGAIIGNPFTKKIEVFGSDIPARYLEVLSLSLATLPALEDVSLQREGNRVFVQLEDHTTMPLYVLLQARSLRSVTFGTRFVITREVVQHLLVALNGSTVTRLNFDGCYFLDQSHVDIAHALQSNSWLTQVEFLDSRYDDAFYVEIEQVLRLNTTLTDLTIACRYGVSRDGESRVSNLPMITALGVNTTLKNVRFEIVGEDNRITSEAMRHSLETNSTLESLSLVLNATLPVSESYWLNLLRETLTVNTSLEFLEIKIKDGDGISSNDYLTCLEALGGNATLKTLRLHPCLDSFGRGQADELLSLIRKNYGIENLDLGLPDPTGEVRCILRLNRAGRQNPS